MTIKPAFWEALLVGAKAGRLLQAIRENSTAEREDRDDLAQTLAALHNEGLVDAVAAFASLKNAPGGPDFFLTRHVFEKALPHINASAGPVMRCVLSLVREAGQDMLAGSIFNGYIEFCTKDAARPIKAIELIEEAPDALADMLTATIAAGSQLDIQYYLREVLRLIDHPNMEIRRRAVFSMARLRWPKGARVPDAAIFALENAANRETDDRILAGTISSAFALFEQDNTDRERLVAIVGVALAKNGDSALHAASEILWMHKQTLPSELLQLLLANLKNVKPENTLTLDNIDYGVASLLKSDDPEPGLEFLKELLIVQSGKFGIKALDSTVAEILQNPKIMGKILTRWFLHGERALCESVREIVNTHHGDGDDLRVEIDESELETSNRTHMILVAHKAIGYFFLKPVTAASVLLSLMRHTKEDETLASLGELLFDPLLLNYPGDMGTYVRNQAKCESGKVKATIDNALDLIERYLEVLRSVPDLPALHPSQSQREIYRRHMSETMSESMRDAEKQSVFLHLVTRSTLLYGNKSVFYMSAGDGASQRMEMPLTSHGVSIDFPRMDNIDYHGLDYMLRVFRAERLRT